MRHGTYDDKQPIGVAINFEVAKELARKAMADYDRDKIVTHHIYKIELNATSEPISMGYWYLSHIEEPGGIKWVDHSARLTTEKKRLLKKSIDADLDEVATS